MPRLCRILWTCLLCCALAGNGPLWATTFIYQTTLDLLKASEAVVVGTVESTRYEERNGRIVTVTTVKIEEIWKGQIVGKTVEIVEDGGIVGDRGSATGGAPQYKQGDRVVTFLEKNKADPLGRMRTTTGVTGRHLVIDSPAGAPANPAQPGAGPKAILARPISDANCDIAGHDAKGRTVLLEYAEMMRIEGRLGTNLEEFRAEVAAYQTALAAGQGPPLSERDRTLVAAFQEALDHDAHHTRTSGGAAAGDMPKGSALPVHGAGDRHSDAPAGTWLAGPGIVVREEDVDRILRENRERRMQEKAAQEQTHTVAWIVFLVSGTMFVGLTLYLRRQRGGSPAGPASDRTTRPGGNA